MNSLLHCFFGSKSKRTPLLLVAVGVGLGFGLSATISQAQEKTPQLVTTRIAIDEEAGSFTFISKGEPVARLDAQGLYILGNVTYSGIITDVGAEALKTEITEPQNEEAAHD